MPTYYIDEIRNDQLVGSHVATGESLEAALQKITGRKEPHKSARPHAEFSIHVPKFPVSTKIEPQAEAKNFARSKVTR